ncbi:MAG: class I SAM-dependent methyltransferase [Candidatus Woesearchaeota archaeon]|jgi:2-polyprenyl-3-methyl-5-hydroxy-6-metoxy-1,4-benzoquinol methylase
MKKTKNKQKSVTTKNIEVQSMKIKKNIFEYVHCNLCGANDYTVMYPSKHGKVNEQDLISKFRSSGDETLIDQVVKCNKCGFIYVNPRIRSDMIFNAYSEGEDQNFVSQAKGRELTFAKCLKLIEKYTKGRRGKILDVGTAGGSFLHVAKKKGWDVYGLEPNKWMGKWCKENYGIDISSKSLFEQKYPSNNFDVVTLWDVLEHMPDPDASLKECNRILKDKGLLVVNYPDIGSWLSQLMKRKWIFLLSVHLFYFNRRTIKKILRKNGYEVITIKPHFQKLGLGYLVFRTKAYSKLLHNVGNLILKLPGLKNIQIPYWLGQTLVVARKM